MRTRHKIPYIVLSAFLVYLTACNQNLDQDFTKDQLQWVEKTLGNMISTEPTWDFYGYDKYRPGQIAAVRALFGEIDISGKLAVTIPDLFSFGHGLMYARDN